VRLNKEADVVFKRLCCSNMQRQHVEHGSYCSHCRRVIAVSISLPYVLMLGTTAAAAAAAAMYYAAPCSAAAAGDRFDRNYVGLPLTTGCCCALLT